MPKLDATHIAERLRSRLAELEASADVTAKDIRALLTPEQTAAMEAAWAEQQQLRKIKRAKTEEEKQQLGWKTNREIQIAAFQQAIADSDKNILGELRKMRDQAEIRQTRIYFDTCIKASDDGYDNDQAKLMENNALTRAGLQRMDGVRTTARLTKRDFESRKIEADLDSSLRKQMTAEELNQQAILEEHEKTIKRGKNENLSRQKIESVRKNLNCEYALCGEHFVFDITEEKLAIARRNAHYRYQGKCSRCGAVLKLSASRIAALSTGFGKYKLIAHETRHGDLFERKKWRLI